MLERTAQGQRPLPWRDREAEATARMTVSRWGCTEGEGLEPPKACTLVVFRPPERVHKALLATVDVPCNLNESTQCAGQSHLVWRTAPGLEELGTADEEHEALSTGGSHVKSVKAE